MRDYIHVVDLSIGHLRALVKIMSSSGVDAYNLGTGKGYSVLDVIKAFEKVSGQRINYKITSRRPGDVAICYADPKKAKDMLNWEAKHDIEKMCYDSWNFIRKKS